MSEHSVAGARPPSRRYGTAFRALAGWLTAAAVAAVLFSSCGNPDTYYVVGDRDQQRELTLLFRLFESAPRVGDDRVFLIGEIANLMSAAGYDDRLTLFLTTYVERHPDDLYDGYYLFMAARNYLDEEARPVAAYYYARVVGGYPDVIAQGKSIQFEALNEITRLAPDPTARANAYLDLISRFPDKVDAASVYYYLGRSYAETGSWDLAFQAYRRFLTYPDAQIPGVPTARADILSQVAFYDSPKDWTMPSLDSLVDAVKTAIVQGNAHALLTYKAKANFFAMSWDQQSTSDPDPTDFPIQAFFSRYIQVADRLDIASDGSEAFLRTTGWADPRISTWYLYFRKVRFPADPEVNGRWEWAGIYFGDRV